MLNKVLFLFLFLNILSSQGKLHPGIPLIQNYSPAIYKDDPQNWDITQDENGIIYIANSGVLIFDGNSWRKVNVTNQSLVRSLEVGNDKRVYVGAIGELGYLVYDSKGKAIYKSLIPRIDEKDRKFSDIWSINITSHGVYFIERTKIFRWYKNFMQVFSGNFIKGFTIDDRVFVTQVDGSISVFENGNKYSIPAYASGNQGSVNLVPFDDAHLLIISSIHGILKLNITDFHNKAKSKFYEKPKLTKNSLLRKINPFNSIKINDSLWAIGTVETGIVFINKNFKVDFVIDESRGLLNNKVHNFYIDKFGNLWCALNQGFSMIEINKNIKLYGQGFNLSALLTAVKNNNSGIYVASYEGVQCLLTNKDKFQKVKNAVGQVFSFFEYDGQLYSLSRNIYHLKGLQAELVYKSSDIVMCAYSPKKAPNYVLLGKYPGIELVKITRNSGDHLNFESSPNEILSKIDDEILEIIEDKYNNIWLSTYKNGLIKLTFSSEFKEIKLSRYDTSHGLPSNIINIANSCNNEIFVGAQNGIYKFYSNENRQEGANKLDYFYQIHHNNMQTFSYLYYYKGVFISTGSVGIEILNLNGKKNKELSENDFYKMDGAINRIDITNDDKILMPNDRGRGLYIYNPSKVDLFTNQYDAIISKIELGRDSILLDGLYFSGSQNKEGLYEYRNALQPNDIKNKIEKSINNIRFTFAAVFYENPDSILFSYILEGFDDSWSKWSKVSSKEYTNLASGSYIFKIKAKNIIKNISRTANFSFEVLPAWYETYYAFVIYFLLFIALIFFFIKIYTYRLKKLNTRLENLVKTRTEELIEANKKIAESARDAGRAEVAINVLHNIGNVLNSMGIVTETIRKKISGLHTESLNKFSELLKLNENNFSEFILNSTQGKKIPGFIEAVNKHLKESKESIVININDLSRHLKQVAEVVKLQQKYSRIGDNKETVEINKIIADVIDMNFEILKNKGVEVVFSPHEIDILQLDKHRIIMILINLLSNAINAVEKNMDSNKKITITCDLIENDKLIISLIDNGIGIENENLTKIFFYNSIENKEISPSFGLHNCANAAKEMGGNLKAESEGIGKGAKFILLIPFKN